MGKARPVYIGRAGAFTIHRPVRELCANITFISLECQPQEVRDQYLLCSHLGLQYLNRAQPTVAEQ